MTIEQLKLLAEADPFRPFVLETTGGNYIRVDKAHHVLFPPPDFDQINIFGADRLVHIITIETINSYATL
jgi:hypothetical protein